MSFLLSAWLQSLPQNSFVGCLKNFQLDLMPLDTPSANAGVTPCLGGSLEKGIYFSQEEGGHILLGKSNEVEFMTLNLKNSVLFLSLQCCNCFFFSFLFCLLKANSVSWGPEFKIVFSIRPRSLTGILIHIGSQPKQHLSVYLEAGQVSSNLIVELSGWKPDALPRDPSK